MLTLSLRSHKGIDDHAFLQETCACWRLDNLRLDINLLGNIDTFDGIVIDHYYYEIHENLITTKIKK
jgi:hypothetical protein